MAKLRIFFLTISKWQQANGVKKCEDGRPKTVRNRQPEKCENASEKVQKRSEKSENRRKSAKTIAVLSVDRFLAIFQWPYSVGSHLGLPYERYWTQATDVDNCDRDMEKVCKERGVDYLAVLLATAQAHTAGGTQVSDLLDFFGRPLKTTFDMTTLIFSSGGCPSYPFYPLKRVPSYPFLAENPSREGATKDHLSSKPPQGEPPGTKNQSGR